MALRKFKATKESILLRKILGMNMLASLLKRLILKSL